MAFPRQYRTKLYSTNSIERLNKEVKRRAGVVRILPNVGLHHVPDWHRVVRAQARVTADLAVEGDDLACSA